MSHLLALAEVRLTLGRLELFKDLSLVLPTREWLGLVGGNGSGKTSLLRLITGLATPDTGEIRVDGGPLVDLVAWRRSLGIVWQRPTFWRGTVTDNLTYPLQLRGLSGTALAAAVAPWLDRLELGYQARHDPETLSTGEAQRLAIGRALIAGPRLLLLDDPTTSCDLQSAKLVESLVAEFHTGGGTVLWATPARGALPPQTQAVQYLYDGGASGDPPSAQLFAGWD
jgi:putative spermidine/putrescine transport system ATP-binding protein